MHGPDGANCPNASEFLEIAPVSLIRIKHLNLPHFELAVSLESGATGTLVSWTDVFENREFAEKMRPFFEGAIKRLAQELDNGVQ